jgi:dissimilatory sulfite reductase (desulfoviridin) alpha/beta subunit
MSVDEGRNNEKSKSQRFGLLRQKEKGYYSVRVKAVAGNCTAPQIALISDLATRYGRGYLSLTTRLNIEIPWVKIADGPAVCAALDEAGLSTGSTGRNVRAIVCCKGTVCPHGLYDTQETCRELDRIYYGKPLPAKFKIGIAGCPNNCTKVQFNDIGIMGQRVPQFEASNCTGCGACVVACKAGALLLDEEGTLLFQQNCCLNCGACIDRCHEDAVRLLAEGVTLFIGGTAGRRVMAGLPLGMMIPLSSCSTLVEAVLAVFLQYGEPGERFRSMMERVGPELVLSTIRDAVQEP